MSSGKLLALAVFGAGAAALFLGSRDAHASVPANWNPPANARRVTLPATGGPGTIAITVAEWPAEAGQPAGVYDLMWDPADRETFVAVFTPTGGAPAVLSVGSTPNAQLLLSTVPGLIAKVRG